MTPVKTRNVSAGICAPVNRLSIGMVAVAVLAGAVPAFAVDPGKDSFGGQVVAWRDVESSVASAPVSEDRTGRNGGHASSKLRSAKGDFSLQRLGAALPPPPRDISAASAVRVQPSSLAGISSAVVPAVTGDLYWSRPALNMRIIGQSLGQNSALNLSKPPVGASVGSITVSPSLVGIK